MPQRWDERLNGGNAFDAVRLILASLVVFEHAYFLVDGGPQREPLYRLTGGQLHFGVLAVYMFFTVSGFLVTRSRLASSLGRYALKRVLRIVPGFLIASVIGVVIVGPLVAPPGQFAAQNWKLIGLTLLALKQANFVGAFPDNPLHLVHGTLWTVRYEFDCYILFGVLGALGLLRGRAAIATFLVLAGAVALATLIPVPKLDTGPAYLLMSSPDQWARLFPFFFVGAAMYIWRERIPKSPWLVAVGLVWMAVAAVTGGLYWALLFGGSYGVLFAALSFKWDARIRGVHTDLSYGVYLYGWLVEQILIAVFRPQPLVLFAMAMPLTLIVAWLSWTLIEAPALRLAHRKRAPQGAVNAKAEAAG